MIHKHTIILTGTSHLLSSTLQYDSEYNFSVGASVIHKHTIILTGTSQLLSSTVHTTIWQWIQLLCRGISDSQTYHYPYRYFTPVVQYTLLYDGVYNFSVGASVIHKHTFTLTGISQQLSSTVHTSIWQWIQLLCRGISDSQTYHYPHRYFSAVVQYCTHEYMTVNTTSL